MNYAKPLFAIASAMLLFSCQKKVDTTQSTTPQQQVVLDLSDTEGVHYFPTHPSFPNNTFEDDKAILGRVLFYDKHLSANNAIACASCHRQELAFADDVAFSRGFEGRLTGRNSMPIQDLMPSFPINSVKTFQFGRLFWDGREQNLKNLVLKPVNNHVEMGVSDVTTLPAKLNELPYYADLVEKAFGTRELNTDNISEAVAYFLMAISADSSRFNKDMITNQEFNALERMGQTLFNSKYECGNCHRISFGQYTNEVVANIGLDKTDKDLGVGALNIKTAIEGGTYGAFRAPNLKNVAKTAPYMHDGRFKTLEEVIDHYSEGIQDNPNLDQRLKRDGKPMRMQITEDDKKAIVAFLNTLTDYDMLTDPKLSNPFKTVQ